MRYCIIILALIILITPLQASAISFTAPEVPDAGSVLMPKDTETFGDGLLHILHQALPLLRPDLAEAAGISLSLIAAVMLLSLLQPVSEKITGVIQLTGAVMIASLLFSRTHSMIRLGIETVTELSEYQKLLLPVITAAIAAQGGITTASALYGGTALFNTLLSRLINSLLLPLLYLYMALAAANSAAGEELLAKTRDLVKSFVQWSLKMILTVFTTYMSITGVVSGTTDAAALKAAKVTISSFVPVVGGILADASESILVSASLVKNAVGVYGILAILAVFLGPFLRIGVQYLVLKYTAAACSLFGIKKANGLIEDFGTVMGMLLAITGTMCVMLLISCICFLKGVG